MDLGGSTTYSTKLLKKTSAVEAIGSEITRGTKKEKNRNNNSSNGNDNSGGKDAAAENEYGVREQDRFMPIANVIRIMRRILPAHAKISDDAKETIQECVSEYISFVTGEANERCQQEQRKTITAEDVLWAMSKLGFDNYVDPLTLYLHRYRELDGADRGTLRADSPALPAPAGRRAAPDQFGALAGLAAFAAPMPAAAFHHMGSGAFFAGAAAVGGYLVDASLAGPSQAVDQFGHHK